MRLAKLNVTDAAAATLRSLISSSAAIAPVIELLLVAQGRRPHPDVAHAVTHGESQERLMALAAKHELNQLASLDFQLVARVLERTKISRQKIIKAHEFSFVFPSGPLILMLTSLTAHRYTLDRSRDRFFLRNLAGRIVLPQPA